MEDQLSISSLTKKHFGFLETEYGFIYQADRNVFDNPVARIYIGHIDYVTPSIKIWFKSEPKFTCLDITWLLRETIDYKSIDKNLLEGNLAYFSNLLREHFAGLITNKEKLLLRGIKHLFISIRKLEKINKKNLLANINFAYDSSLRKYYYYIKKKDPVWDPSKEL